MLRCLFILWALFTVAGSGADAQAQSVAARRSERSKTSQLAPGLSDTATLRELVRIDEVRPVHVTRVLVLGGWLMLGTLGTAAAVGLIAWIAFAADRTPLRNRGPVSIIDGRPARDPKHRHHARALASDGRF